MMIDRETMRKGTTQVLGVNVMAKIEQSSEKTTGRKIRLSDDDWVAITGRFKNFFGLRFNSELATLLNISKEGLLQFRPRGSLPYDKLIHVALKNNANLNWLFTGRGEMGANADLQDENEQLRIELVKKDAIIEYQKEMIQNNS